MKKIKLQPREKLIVSVALLAVVGYFFYTFWYQPHSDKVSSTQAQINSLKDQISKDQDLLRRQKALDANSTDIEAKAHLLQNQLPPVDALPSVLQDLQAVMTGAGITVNNMALDTGTNPKGIDPSLDSRNVQVNFSGAYPQIDAAVQRIENNQLRLFSVSNLTLNGDKGKLTGSMSVQIYFGKNPLPGFAYKPILVTQGKANPFAQ